MRTRRILAVALAVVATGLLAATPAHAGNWEETLLDPPPARIEAGVTYTFGYWILQHGSYPFQDGDLGPTALRAVDGDTVLDFRGTPTRTPGHYSAEVVFPHEGRWSLSSRHEVLMPDEDVATVTVPGAVAIAPSQMTERAPYDWGTVRPSFPPAAPDAEMAPPTTAPVESRDVAPRGHATTEARPPGSDLPVWLVIAGGAATIGFAFLLVRRAKRATR
jgi:hypothetical protein